MKAPTLILSAVASLLASAYTASAEIIDITHGGTGCPQGSISPKVSGNTVSYVAPFLVRAGPGISPIESRKNCQININYKASDSTRLIAVRERVTGGVVRFSNSDSKATFKTIMYYSGRTEQASNEELLQGTGSRELTITNEFKVPPCVTGSQGLNINTQARFHTGGVGVIDFDSAVFSYELVFGPGSC